MRILEFSQLLKATALALPLIMFGCNPPTATDGDTAGSGGTGGSGGGTTPSANSARISGSVTLSSSVAGANKPSVLLQKSASEALRYKATPTDGIQVSNKPNISSGLESISLLNAGDPVASAWVYLYNAEQPDWLAPVAQDVTDSSGTYEFEFYGCTDEVDPADCVAEASENGDEYNDGDPLPKGVYTMLIYKPSTFDPILGITTDPIVSVMPAFRADDDDFTVEEAEAEVSDASPNVVSIFGVEKNTDGTNTWGSSGLEIPANAAIQVSFDMAMSRGSVQRIAVANGSVVEGSWSLSPDWLTATFTPDADLGAGEYTVTIPSSTVNVYSNALGYKAVGTFTAVSSDSTPPTVLVTKPAATTDVPATSPIRITSNEVLNINSLRVESTPSIGDFPGVKLVDSNGVDSFVYEIIATESLQLGTSYNMTFSGIEDGAGNTAANLTKAFSTQGADDAEGVDSTANDETKAAQVAISEIFAKWVLAVNERNPSAIAGLMSGGFIFEYSVQAEEGFRDEDINRNGRLSLKEFMRMIEQGMLHWEFCDTTVTGEIEGNVQIESASAGNFEFTLAFSSDNQGQECGDDDGEPIYATVKKVNGLWKLVRMSEGFDHRGTPVGSLELIEAQLYEVADNADGEALVANWQQMENFADDATPFTFKFDHVNGVESYVFLLANERDPAKLGFAFVVSADVLACKDSDDPQNCEATEGDDLQLTVPDPFGDNGMPTGAYPVLNIFGFDGEKNWGIDNPGEVFMWEIIGLKSITSLELKEMSGDKDPDSSSDDGEQQVGVTDDTNGPDVTDIVALVRDISAVSAVKRFQNPGEYVELDIEVTANGSPLEFNIYDGGFNAVDANQVVVTITAPGDLSAPDTTGGDASADPSMGGTGETNPDGNPDGGDFQKMGGFLFAHSHIGFGEYPLTFTYDANTETSTASATVDLFTGWTWIEVSDGMSLYENFQIVTEGGKGPDVEVLMLSAFDSNLADLLVDKDDLGQWSFLDASSGELGVAEGAVTLEVNWDMTAGYSTTVSDGVNRLEADPNVASQMKFDLADVIDILINNQCSHEGVGWANLDVNVWNDSGAYYRVEYCSHGPNGPSANSDIVISGNSISLAADLKVFEGDNWVSLNIHGDDGNNNWYQTQSSFGVYTDAGSEFTPPIALVSATSSEGTPAETGNWGQGIDLDATDITKNTDVVTIVVDIDEPGVSPNVPLYHAGSDGICCNDGELTLVSGTQYSLELTLYNGFNWISIEDGNGNWYNVNIFTENGAEVPKPKFVSANGVDIPEPEDRFGPVRVAVDQCLITVAGTAPANTKRLHVNWNGGSGMENYWEGQEINLPSNDTDTLQTWTATFQLVSGANSYNNIDVYDESNQSGAHMEVVTSAADCAYTAPLLTVDGVRIVSEAGTELVTDGYQYGTGTSTLLTPVTDTAAWVYGTSSIPGRFITVRSHMCGQEVKFGANASTVANQAGTYDWVVQIEVFDEDDQAVDNQAVFATTQWLDVSDGPNYQNISILSDSNNLLTPALSVQLPTGFTESTEMGYGSGCSFVMWEGGQATEITVQGNTLNPDAKNGFGQAYTNSGFVDFQIDENGNFSFTVDLFDGYNHIGVNDGRGGFFDISVNTANGVFPPQYVFITSHDSASTGVGGDITIVGNFDSQGENTNDFAPDWMNAYISYCVDVDCINLNFDSNLAVKNEYASPMAYDPNAPANGFSFNVTIPADAQVYIDVWGCGKDGCHGHSFGINDGTSDDNHFYKPGSVVKKATDYAHRYTR